MATKPGSATRPFFGIQPEVVNKEGQPVPAGHGGLLVIRKPWPSMARTVYGDPERYRKTYWSDVPGCYFTGDGARQDADGYFWLMGRVDDVINVSGHRLGTMEVESALVAHPKVAEAAVVGRPDELKGQAISAFVSLESGNQPSEEFEERAAQVGFKGDRLAGPPCRDPPYPRPAQDAHPAISCAVCSGYCGRPRSRATSPRSKTSP